MDLYTKSTDKHQHLNTKSCHPRHCKMAFPFSQVLRLHRICSEQDNLVLRCQQLKQHLEKRGYPEQLLDKEIRRAISVLREEEEQGRKNSISGDVSPRHPFFFPHHQTSLSHLAKLGASERDVYFTTDNHFPTPKESQRFAGARNLDITYKQYPWLLPVQFYPLQNLPYIEDHKCVH